MEVPVAGVRWSFRPCGGRRWTGGSLLVAAALCAPAGGGEEGLSPDQRGRLIALRGTVQQAPAGSEAWFAAAEELLQLGETGKKELRAVLDLKLRGLRTQYLGAFALRARRLLADRLAESARQSGRNELDREIRGLRADVAGLLSSGGLSKARIQSTADPAIKRLSELLLVDPTDVLKGEAELSARRTALHAVLGLRDRVDRPAGGNAKTDLAAVEETGVLLAIPADAYARRMIEHNARHEGELQAEEAAGIRTLNRIRLLLAMPALQVDLRLCQAARDHSRDMVERRFFSHVSPVPGKRSFGQRARRAGTRASGENIAAGTSTGAGAIRMWFHSPGHLRNMLGRHRRVGLGRARKTWTMLLGR